MVQPHVGDQVKLTLQKLQRDHVQVSDETGLEVTDILRQVRLGDASFSSCYSLCQYVVDKYVLLQGLDHEVTLPSNVTQVAEYVDITVQFHLLQHCIYDNEDPCSTNASAAKNERDATFSVKVKSSANVRYSPAMNKERGITVTCQPGTSSHETDDVGHVVRHPVIWPNCQLEMMNKSILVLAGVRVRHLECPDHAGR